MSIDRDKVIDDDGYIRDTFIQNSHISESEKDELRLVRDRAREAKREYSEISHNYLKIQNICESDKNELRVRTENYREAQIKYVEALCRSLNKLKHEIERIDRCQNQPLSSKRI